MSKLPLWAVLFFVLSSWVSPTIGQDPPTKAPTVSGVHNLFSIWTRLSLAGYSQSEIESALGHIPVTELNRTKHYIRLNVIKNLRSMNLVQDIRTSNNSHQLSAIRSKIETEIRFAGLENDRHLRHMIQNYFGIKINPI